MPVHVCVVMCVPVVPVVPVVCAATGMVVQRVCACAPVHVCVCEWLLVRSDVPVEQWCVWQLPQACYCDISADVRVSVSRKGHLHVTSCT